jgi:hypothetical protein
MNIGIILTGIYLIIRGLMWTGIITVPGLLIGILAIVAGIILVFESGAITWRR